MTNHHRISGATLIVMLLLFSLTAYAAQQSSDRLPQPREVLGFEPGEDRKLADWSQIVDYFKRLDSASERVSVHQPGVSTDRRPFIVAIISSEENIRNLDRIRAAQKKLADPRLIANAAERERLLSETPAIVAITCSIHSTEVVAAQMSMELAYRMASDNSKATADILRNVVLVLVPSVNPDGIDIVANWYRKTLGTKFEGTSPPELYHRYTGHDNNRDWFMLTQVETRIVSTLFWKEWFPEVVYDVHQQGEYGSRMCVPPFFDPQNPNIDPVILRQVGTIGMKMALNLTAAGFKGVVTNSTYDTWWHGGLRTAPYYHNAVGILTEAASARLATPVEIKREQLRSSTRGLANPLVTATNHPVAWEGGTWRPRDIMNMEMITVRTLLEETSLHREELIRNFVDVATRAIEAGATGSPYAYIVPARQHDAPTAERMISILIQQGVEVHRARADFTHGGKKYGAGSYVILLAQPYRANVKCLFEPQKYPDRRLYPGGPAEPPYDVAGWTLPMQMGVDYEEAAARFDAALEKIDSLETARADLRASAGNAPPASRERPASAAQLYVAPNANNAFAFINEAFKSSDQISVSRLKQPARAGEATYPAGTFLIEYKPAKKRPSADDLAAIKQLALKYGVETSISTLARGRDDSSPASEIITRPRVALYRSWVVSMDEGWTRWVLEQFGFQYASLTDAEVRAGNLRDKFDVVILPDQSMQQIVSGHRATAYPSEYTGGITDAGVDNLKSFVEAGGVLICLNSSSELAMRRFELPVRNALAEVRRDQFYAPGSIFRARLDISHPIAYGMPSEADLYFVSSARRQSSDPSAAPDEESAARPQSQPARGEPAAPEAAAQPESQRRDASVLVRAFAFEITDAARARSVANYVEGNPLRSGWLLGPEYVAGKSALVDVSLGKGRVVLFGFRTQHRAQTWGTFKLLFNSILLGGAPGTPRNGASR
jgi:hypothetical protein